MSTGTTAPATSATNNLYEGMFLLDSGKFAADPDDVMKQILRILEKAGGTIVANRPWQDGRLAYPIEGHRKGLHFLVLFRMPATIRPWQREAKNGHVWMSRMSSARGPSRRRFPSWPISIGSLEPGAVPLPTRRGTNARLQFRDAG